MQQLIHYWSQQQPQHLMQPLIPKLQTTSRLSQAQMTSPKSIQRPLPPPVLKHRRRGTLCMSQLDVSAALLTTAGHQSQAGTFARQTFVR